MPTGKYLRRDTSNLARAAKARGQTGFLHPVIRYEVREGTKIRHQGTNRRDAMRAYTTWCNFAKNREGTPQPTTITLTADNKPIQTETIKP